VQKCTFANLLPRAAVQQQVTLNTSTRDEDFSAPACLSAQAHRDRRPIRILAYEQMPDAARRVVPRRTFFGSWRVSREPVMETSTADEHLAGIADFRIFRYFDSDQFASVKSDFRKVKFRRGDSVIRDEAKSSGMYLVCSGNLFSKKYSRNGTEVGFSIITAGDYTGELGAVDGKPRWANVICLDDAELIFVSQTLFDRMIEEIPGFGRALLEDLVSMARSLSQRLFERNAASARSRVILFLLRSAAKAGVVDDRVTLSRVGTHAQIAALVGTQREVVTRELTKLSRIKAIRNTRNTIEICSYEMLRRLASVDAA
jgi:CRP-like cAMP-binding protein